MKGRKTALRRFWPAIALLMVCGLALVALAGGGPIIGERLRNHLRLSASRAFEGVVSFESATALAWGLSPSLALRDVRIESAAGVMAADRIDLALRLGALLRGEVVLAEATVIRPRFGMREGGPISLLAALSPPESGTFWPERIELVDGALRIAGVGIDRFELVVERRGPSGPIEARGGGRIADAAIAFLLETGRIDARGSARLRLDGEFAGAKVGLRGLARLAGARSAFAGSIALETPDAERIARLLGSEIPGLGKQPIALDGDLTVERSEIALDGALELAGRPWSIEARGARDHVARIGLETRRATLADLGALGSAARALAASRLAPGALLSVNARTIGQGAAPASSNGRFEGRIAGDALVVERLSARLPGDGAFEFVGEIGPAAWSGDLAARARDLGAASRALGLDVENAALDGLAADGSAAIEWSASRARIDGLAARIGREEVFGELALRFGEPRRVDARLDVGRIAIDRRALRELLALIPLEWRRAAFDVDLAIERVTSGGERALELTAELRREEGGAMAFDVVSPDFAGASLVARGDLAFDRSAMDVELALARASPARLGRWFGFDLEALDGIGRTNLSLQIERNAESAQVAGELNADGLAASLAARADGPLDDPRVRLRADAFVDRSERIGGSAAIDPARAGAPARIGVVFARRPGEPARGVARTSAYGVSAEFAGAIDLAGGSLEVIGDLLARGGDLALARRAAAALSACENWPGSWPGRWPAAALELGWLNAAAIDLDLSDGERDLARLSLIDGTLRLGDIDVELADGALEGWLELAARDPLARGSDMAFRGALRGRELDLATLAAAAPPIETDFEIAWRASGRSPLDWARSLAGEGRLLARAKAPILGIERIEGGYEIEGGIVRSEPEGWRASGGERLDAAFDASAWIASVRRTDAEGRTRHWLGPPFRLEELEGAPALASRRPLSGESAASR